MGKFAFVGFVGGLIFAFAQIEAHAEVLITADEAKLPSSVNVAVATRGITRGPGIEQVSPNPESGVTSPLPFKVKFDIRNQVDIDSDSVKLTYLKATPVDLTSRIKKHLTAGGIEMDQAEVPAGTHVMRLDIKDKQGRVASAIIRFVVKDK